MGCCLCGILRMQTTPILPSKKPLMLSVNNVYRSTASHNRAILHCCVDLLHGSSSGTTGSQYCQGALDLRSHTPCRTYLNVAGQLYSGLAQYPSTKWQVTCWLASNCVLRSLVVAYSCSSMRAFSATLSLTPKEFPHPCLFKLLSKSSGTHIRLIGLVNITPLLIYCWHGKGVAIPE